MSIVSDAVKGLFEPATKLIGKMVKDKDLAMKLQMELTQLYAESMKSARDHDKATYGIWLVDFVRGMVRPTITAFYSYLFFVAKMYPEKGITLSVHDYAVIGGVLAFWFGGRFLGKDIQK